MAAACLASRSKRQALYIPTLPAQDDVSRELLWNHEALEDRKRQAVRCFSLALVLRCLITGESESTRPSGGMARFGCGRAPVLCLN